LSPGFIVNEKDIVNCQHLRHGGAKLVAGARVVYNYARKELEVGAATGKPRLSQLLTMDEVATTPKEKSTWRERVPVSHALCVWLL
jgi:hypothetical protein